MDRSSGWDNIEFGCKIYTAADGEPCERYATPAETSQELSKMAKDHFPEGPASAVEPHEAYCAWQAANVMIFFRAEKDRPQIPEVGRRWRAFAEAWSDRSSSEQWMMGRVLAVADLGRGLNLRHQVERQKPRSWRARRQEQAVGPKNKDRQR
jgi:hypothetical protein